MSPVPDSEPEASPAYARVEGAHLRQWAQRIVVPLAALATNGAARLDVSWLPRHDAPGFPSGLETSFRIAGAAAVVASAVLRVLAKGVLVRKTTLTTGGVYGLVRHPFYLANLVGAAGVFLLAGSLGAVAGAVWLAVAAPIYRVTIAGEERGLARLFPDEFRSYAARVRALLPGVPPAGRPAARVTWANLLLEREPPRLMRFGAGAALVFGLTVEGATGVAVLAAAGTVFAASYAVGRRTSRGAPPEKLR